MVFVIMGSQLDKTYEVWKQVWNKPEAFRTLVEKSVSGIVLVNDKYTIEYVNESVCTILGCTREELLSHDFRDFLQPDTVDLVVERYSRMLDGNKISASYEMKIIRGDAEVRDLEISSGTVMNSDEGIKIAVQILDVTEEKKTRLALLESEQKFRKTFEAITDPAFIWRRHPNGRIVLHAVNQRMLTFAKGAMTKFIDNDLDVAFSRNPEICTAVRHTMETGKAQRMELPYVTHHGSRRWLIWDLTKPDDDLVLLITTDITERMIMERQLRNAKEKAILYLDLLGHDMGNQLQVMKGFMEIQLQKAQDPHSAKRIEYALAAIARCEKTISKTKTIEHIIIQPLKERTLDDALRHSVEAIKRSCADVAVDLSIRESNAQVIADDFLELLFMTILENSCEHHSKKDRHIWASLGTKNDGYEVSISDNGPGIPDEAKEILFDPTRRFGGVGLHLAHHLVEKYSGNIIVLDRVVGEPDRGVEFRIWLPNAR